MSILSLDWETRSTVDLKKSGVYVYAESPDTDIWVGAWAFDEEEPEIWTPGMPVPERIVEHVKAGGEIRAWNAQFERLIWWKIATPRYGWPVAAMEQFVCSAAEAAAMALPRHLAGAAHVLGVEQQKDDKGYRLMLQMARPRKIHEDGTITWWDVPAKKEVLFAYCKQDVRTEKSIVQALRRLTPREREVYLLDQRINDRGIHVDAELVRAAQLIVDQGVTRANARLDDLTNGQVTAITNNKRLTAWINEAGTATDSISKAAVAALLERDDLAENVEEVLQLRAEAGRSSVAKLKSLLDAMCTDGRARGLLLYHGASTGRWTGKLVQPQNFPRGELNDIEQYIPLVMAGEYDALDLFAPPIVVVLSMLRSMLTARPGHELVSGDFSAIEARVLNWLAGQDDIVDLFRAMDAGDKSRHPYKVMAWRMGRAESPDLVKKPSDDYQAGKAAELGCGFGMGDEKFVGAAWNVYQLRVTPEQAKDAVRIYRETHPRVKAFWYETERACIDAVLKPGTVHAFGARKNLKATKRGGYLYVVLPSGRPLCYAAPSVKKRAAPWCDECGKPEKAHTKESTHAFVPAMKDALHFWGVDSFTRQWSEQSAYGGLLVENIVQAVARDLMAEAMFRAEAAGYQPVLSVHDEVVTEVPEGFGTLKAFEALMSELPVWAAGCPVAAEGWRGFRYRK